MRLKLTAIFLFLLGVSEFAFADGVDSALLAELRTAGVAAWADTENAYNAFQVQEKVTTSTSTVGVAKAQVVVSEYFIAFDAATGLTLNRTQYPTHPDWIGHEVANRQYTFEVHCPQATERGTLSDVHVLSGNSIGNSVEYDAVGVPTWGLKRFGVLAACRITGIPLQNFLEENGNEFRLDSLTENAEGDKQYIELVASYLGEQRPGRRQGGVYRVLIDREQDYRVESFAIDRPEAKESFANTYFEAINGYRHAPERVVYSLESPAEKISITHEFSAPQKFAIPDKEFYLPHYGFSEQVLETLNPNPWPRWLLVLGGILSLVIGFWLLNRRERTSVA